MLRGLFLSIVLLLPLSVTGNDDAKNDPKMDLAIELLALMDMDQIIEATRGQIESMIAAQIDQVAECDAMRPAIKDFSRDMGALVTTQLSADAFMPQIAQIYVDVFTENELEAVLAFYRSPVGEKMLTKMPELMQRSMAISQAQVTALMPRIEAAATEFGEKIEAARSECENADD